MCIRTSLCKVNLRRSTFILSNSCVSRDFLLSSAGICHVKGHFIEIHAHIFIKGCILLSIRSHQVSAAAMLDLFCVF